MYPESKKLRMSRRNEKIFLDRNTDVNLSALATILLSIIILFSIERKDAGKDDATKATRTPFQSHNYDPDELIVIPYTCVFAINHLATVLRIMSIAPSKGEKKQFLFLLHPIFITVGVSSSRMKYL